MSNAGRLLFPLFALLGVLGACESAEEAATAALPVCRIAQPVVPLPAELPEASGAAASRAYPGVVWTHNDSGWEADLFAVDAAGQVVGRVRVTGAKNEDWEDVGLGRCPAGDCLYVGDFGDNAARRSAIQVYRVPEPAPTDSATAPPEHFPMRYPGGPRNAEALFVLPPDRLFIVTKGNDGPVELYRYPGPLRRHQTVELELVRPWSMGPVPRPDLVTGAEASADGEWVAIRTYTSILLYPTAELLEPTEAMPIRVDLAAVGEAQGEGIAFGRGGTLVLTGEGGGNGVPGTLAILWCALLDEDPLPASRAISESMR